MTKEKKQTELGLHQEYLLQTDWLIIREAETGVTCPKEVKTKRQAARKAISQLREEIAQM